MGLKLNYTILVSILVLCLGVYGVFAVTSTDTGEFSATPETLYLTWQDAGTGFGCYANTTRITNNIVTAINVTVDNTTTVGGASFYVNDGNNNVSIIELGGSTWKDIVLKFDASSLTTGTYTANITLYNTTNSTEELEFIAKVVVPTSLSDLANVGSMPKVNIGQSKVIAATFYINNTEDYPITITKVENTTILRKGTTNMTYTHDLVDSTVIAANTNGTYTATITVDTSKTSNSPGIYTDQLNITSDNGCPSQIYNLTLSANLTSHMDVVVAANSSLSTDRNQNVSVGVVPTYVDGTFVDNLVKANFTAAFIHRNLTGTISATIKSVEDKGTYYNVTVTVPSTILGGDQSVEITVKDGLGTGVNNTGTGFFGYFDVQRPALKLTTDCEGRTVEVGDGFTCKQYVYNYGSVDATEVNLTYSRCTDYLTAAGSNDGEIGDVLAGDYEIDSASYVADAVTTGCDLRIVGESAAGDSVWHNRIKTPKIIVVAVTDNTSQQNNNNDNLGGSGGFNIVITPPTFEVEQGNGTTEIVNVENTGSYTVNNAELTLSGIDASWYDIITEKQTIIVTLDEDYEVEFDIPEDTEPIEYTITYKIKGDGIEETATGKMKVTPGEVMQTEIEANLTEYKKWYTTVLGLFNETKLSGGNTTELDDVESLLLQITGLLTAAESHITLGEYFEAYQDLKEARTLLLEAEGNLTGEKTKLEDLISGKFVWVGAGIIIVIAIVGIYFYTQSTRGGYKSYKPRGKNLGLHGKRKIAGTKLKFEQFKKDIKRKKDNFRRR